MSNEEIAKDCLGDALKMAVVFYCRSREETLGLAEQSIQLTEERIKQALDLKDSQAQAKIAELRGIIKVKDVALEPFATDSGFHERVIDDPRAVGYDHCICRCNGIRTKYPCKFSIAKSAINHHEAKE